MRRSAEFERFWGACEEGGAVLASVVEPIDTSTEMGLAIVRVLVTFATLESATKSLRIKAKALEQAQLGQHRGGPKMYGLTPDAKRIVPREAAVIRLLARRIVERQTMPQIIRELRAMQIPTPRGKKAWRHEVIRGLLLRRRLVGDLVFHGEVMARDAYPRILDDETFERVRALLADRSSHYATRGAPGLLGGLLYCGVCGARLARRSRGRLDPEYQCPRPPGGCHGVTLRAPMVDQWLSDLVLWRLTQRSTSQIVTMLDPPAESSATALREHADALLKLSRDYYVEGRIGQTEFLSCRAALEERLQRTQRGPVEPAHGLSGLEIVQLRERWPRMTIQRRREVIERELQRATVQPAGLTPGRFDSDRIEPTWWAELPTTAGPVPYGLRGARHQRDNANHRPRPRFGELDVKEAAALLGGATPHLVRALIHRGDLRAYKVQGFYWLTARDVQEYLERHRVRNSPSPGGAASRGREAPPLAARGGAPRRRAPMG